MCVPSARYAGCCCPERVDIVSIGEGCGTVPRLQVHEWSGTTETTHPRYNKRAAENTYLPGMKYKVCAAVSGEGALEQGSQDDRC